MIVQKKIIKINKNDNVAIALIDLKRSDIFLIDKIKVKIKENIKKGHKFTLKKVLKDCDIIKYGYSIGKATSNIEPGYHVHKHNLKTNLDKLKDYEFNQKLEKLDCNNRNLFFYGYHRANGRVGIRNELWVIPTVGCVNKTAERIVQRFKENINEKIEDDVKAFRHDYGCSQYGVDLKTTQKLLKSMILHPNAAGVLVLGLGCEHNQILGLKKIMPAYDRYRIKFLIAQEVEDEISRGVEILKNLYHLSKKDQREKIPPAEDCPDYKKDKEVSEKYLDSEIYPTTPWNYALDINEDNPESSIKFKTKKLDNMVFSPEGAPIEAKVKGRKIPEWKIHKNAAAEPPVSPVSSKEDLEELTLIPYGSTNLRVTEFPVLKKDSKN